MQPQQCRFGPFYLDTAEACLWQGTQRLAVRPKTFSVLAYLVANAGQLVTKDAILDAVWPDAAVNDGVLKTSVQELRRLLGEAAKVPQFISTELRRGYRFITPVIEEAEVEAIPEPAPNQQSCCSILKDNVTSTRPFLQEAERRQLIILFCDFVGSTALASQLDLEELRDIMRIYRQSCTEVVRRFDGYIAQYLGDGILVYFGYPAAHEDDAQRAVHAGLGIMDAMQTLTRHNLPILPSPLAVRVGIHTGLVVMDIVEEGERREPLALGEAVHVANRLQSVAVANTIVVSDVTHRLVEGYFTAEALKK